MKNLHNRFSIMTPKVKNLNCENNFFKQETTGKWAGAAKEDLDSILTPDELTLINCNLDSLSEDLKEFKELCN